MESTFTDGNTFPIGGKSFTTRYFPDTQNTFLLRTNAVTITQEEINEAIKFENAITTDGAINYGQVFPSTNEFLPIGAPEQFVTNFANSPNLQRTVLEAAKTVSGQTIPQTTAPNPDQQGGSTPTNPAPPGTSQKPEKAYLMYPLELKSSQDRIMFQAYEYQSGNRLNPDNAELDPVKYVKPKQPIFMAIQSSITDQNSVGWESDTLNPIEKFAAGLSRGLMGEEGAKTDIGAKVSDIFRGAAENLKVEKGPAGEAVRTYLVGQAIGVNNLLSRLQGQVLNPNLELLFQGPQLRPFNFAFKMSARNKNEAVEIKQIIKYFKKNMAAKKSETGIFLSAPNVFKIQYQYGSGIPHPGLNLIKMCALTNCSIDYTPLGSYTTYNDGTMVAYNMTLSFQELTPIYDGDYDKEFKYGEEAGTVPLTYYTENNGIGP